MFVCRTLDYIVNTDLHLYPFVKFDEIRSKGIQVEIELTESITRIPMDTGKYIEIVNMVLDNAIDSLMECTDKKMIFYMFYTNGELNLVIQYPFGKERSNKTLDTALEKHKNCYFSIDHKKGTATQYLIVH